MVSNNKSWFQDLRKQRSVLTATLGKSIFATIGSASYRPLALGKSILATMGSASYRPLALDKFILATTGSAPYRPLALGKSIPFSISNRKSSSEIKLRRKTPPLSGYHEYEIVTSRTKTTTNQAC